MIKSKIKKEIKNVYIFKKILKFFVSLKKKASANINIRFFIIPKNP